MNSQLQQASSIQSRLAQINPLSGSGRGNELSGRLDFIRRLFDAKIVHEMKRSFEDPLLVVVAGGTNVGKTELFNALCGQPVASPDPRAGRTRRPALFVPTTRLQVINQPDFIKGYDRSALDDPADLDKPMDGRRRFHYRLGDGPGGRNLILVDSPDIDSNRLDNVATAMDLLAAADVIVFVTSPSKYNDEACVKFLDRALALGKHLKVVLNLLDDEADKVIGDFKTAVLGREKHPPELDIIEVPRFAAGPNGPAGMSERIDPLLASLAGLPLRQTKTDQANNALAYVREELADIVKTLKKEIQRLERLVLAAEDDVGQARTGYRDGLTREPFLEIEAVFQEVLDHFHVPIVDDILKAPGKAVKWAVRKVQGRDSERDEIESGIRRRKEQDRRRLAETADAIRARTLKSIITGASDPLLAEVLERARQGPLDQPAEPAAEKIWDELEPEFQRWKDEMRREMIERIQDSPNLKALLQAGKAVLQVGSGVLAAVLIGGIGTTDLVIGPLAAKFTQYILETFGSTYFAGKRDAYLELHLDRFDRITGRTILEPLKETLPSRPDVRELDDIAGAVDRLTIGAS